VLATLNYIIADNFSASAGYKVIDVDYAHDGHAYGARLSGPCWGQLAGFEMAAKGGAGRRDDHAR
jgi:hypothetical protein